MGPAFTLAIFDIGTNAFRLQAVRVSAEGMTILGNLRLYTKLGKGFRDGRIDTAALERCRDAFEQSERFIAEHGCTDRTGIGTFILRNAVNVDELVPYLKKNRIRIVQGREEAGYALKGVGYDIDISEAVVIDIGGGSTEFAVRDRAAVDAESLHFGAVMLIETYGLGKPGDAAPARRYVRREMARLSPTARRCQRMVAIGGTVTTLSMIVQGLDEYDIARIHRSSLRRDQVDWILERLWTMDVAERVDRFRVDPGRADVFHAGVLILQEIMRFFSLAEVTVSHHGIRRGLALTAAEEHGFAFTAKGPADL